MIRALWLTSWYPNKSDAMTGDFIQRHARAASLFCKVDVIHVEADKNNVLTKNIDVDIKRGNNLSETIILFKPIRIPFAGKLISLVRYFTLFRKYVKQYIKTEGRPDLVHVHVPVKAGIIALWLKRKYEIPYAVTEHYGIYNPAAEGAYGGRSAAFKYFTKRIFENGKAFLPVSRYLGNAVQQMVSAIPFKVIPNVADISLFNTATTKEKNKNIFRFIHVSVLQHHKNPEGILRAFARFYKAFPYAELMMAGEKPAALIQYANSLKIDEQHISFTGLVSYSEVAEMLKQSDAFVMFSRHENLPCVIIEALCCGLPVISTNVGGIPELIDKSNGILINNEDEDALFHSMKQMYLNYKNYDKHTIAETAQKKFSFQTVGKQIHDAYCEVLGETSETNDNSNIN